MAGDLPKYTKLSNEISEKLNADVVLFSSTIDSNSADRLIQSVKSADRKANIMVLLTTRGGKIDDAYRIARCLKKYYDKLIVYIFGRCKSAGTLVCLAADELVISDYGELGPLDIQLDKKDELFENTSGLNIIQALNSLNERTLEFYEKVLIGLRSGSRGQISTNLASQIAADVSIGVYSEIYEQVDPVQLGSIERSLSIAHDYGNRLKSKNVKENTLDKLINAYSSHGFVIDIGEAKELFENVRVPNETEELLAQEFFWTVRDESQESFVVPLNNSEEDDASGTPHENDTE